jgi:hypothetical protein
LDCKPLFGELITHHTSIKESVLRLKWQVKNVLDAEVGRKEPLKDLEELDTYYSTMQHEFDGTLMKMAKCLKLAELPKVEDKSIIGGLDERLYRLFSLLNTAREIDLHEHQNGAYKTCLELFIHFVAELDNVIPSTHGQGTIYHSLTRAQTN